MLNPRKAVLDMAPYSPPSGGRAGKLRLDFNENTVGCSPRVIEFLRAKLCEQQLSIYPEYTKAKPALAAFAKKIDITSTKPSSCHRAWHRRTTPRDMIQRWSRRSRADARGLTSSPAAVPERSRNWPNVTASRGVTSGVW